jgi:hypothetical protein
MSRDCVANNSYCAQQAAAGLDPDCVAYSWQTSNSMKTNQQTSVTACSYGQLQPGKTIRRSWKEIPCSGFPLVHLPHNRHLTSYSWSSLMFCTGSRQDQQVQGRVQVTQNIKDIEDICPAFVPHFAVASGLASRHRAIIPHLTERGLRLCL